MSASMTAGNRGWRARARRVFATAMIAGAMIGLSGCVSQGDWDKLYQSNRSLTDANARLQQERDEARSSADLLKQQLDREQAANAQLANQVGALRTQLDAAAAQLAGLGKRIEDISTSPLDTETDQALEQLARQYPDLIIYDADKGRLRFASDVAFDSGSDVVRDNARASLRALAQILNSPSASAYELHIVGHTDSQRISANTAKRHPTNMHLSCHRAISVRAELITLGVDAAKMEAAGWGEYRPLVANTSSGNTPQNRRVEIYLTRPKGGAMGAPEMAGGAAAEPQGGRATPSRERPPERQIDVTK